MSFILKNSIKIIFAITALVVFYGLFFDKKNPETPVAEIPIVSTTSERMCFQYDQSATTEAPYEVHEKIDITISDGKITGVKSGTQKGPDMTNGYEGTLGGTLLGSRADVLFSYTIEGSSQKEQELYDMKNDSLVKLRYVLREEKGILVPDTSSLVREIVYKKIECDI